MRRLLLALIFAPCFALAEPFVCFTGPASTSSNSQLPATTLAWSTSEAFTPDMLLQTASLSCETTQHLELGLNATAIVLSTTGFALACTGVGAPATVWLEGSAIGVQALAMIVGQLPCEDTAREAEVQELAQKAVCEALERNGITCNLH